MFPYHMVDIWTNILEVGTKYAPIVKHRVIFVRCNKLKYTIKNGRFNTLEPYGVGIEFSG